MIMRKDTLIIKTIQKHKKIPDIIADSLRDGILRGTFEGGSSLKQDEIAEKFDVSLIPVREAIFQLEAQGLVASIRHKGVIVTPLSLDEMRMVFELRMILEAGAAKIIVDKIEKDKIHQLKNLMVQMEEKTDLYRFNSLNTLFHQILLDSTYNIHLSEAYRHLFVRVERYCMCILSEPFIMKKIKKEHRAMITCIEEKKCDQLSHLLAEHINESQRLFVEQVLHKSDRGEPDWNNILRHNQLQSD